MKLVDFIHKSVGLMSRQTVLDLTRPTMEYDVEIVDQYNNVLEIDKAGISILRAEKKIKILVNNPLFDEKVRQETQGENVLL